MSDPARQAFDRLYGHLLLSGQDAAWHVFKSGWEARKMKPLPLDQGWYWISDNECISGDIVRKIEAAHGIIRPTIQHLPSDDTEGGAA